MSLVMERARERTRTSSPNPQAPKQPRPSAGPLSSGAVASISVVLTISFLAGWFVLYSFFFSALQQHRDNAVLYKQFRQNLAEAVVPIGQPIAPSTPIALLHLPSAGVGDQVVVEGTSASDLAKGVGHLRSTPLPGQPGVSVLYGRSLTYGAPFGDLGKLGKGDKFTVTTGQGTFHYVVDAVRRVGDPGPATLSVGGSRIMLQTSTGSRLWPSHPLYVDATLQDKPVAAASAPLANVAKSEQAFGTDHSHLTQLVFWLQGLLIAVLLSIWAAVRWGRWQAWLIGVPVVLATLWGATGAAMTLLPNLV